MNLFTEALAWLADPANTPGLLARTGEHLAITALTILLASALALPAGLIIGHRRRGRALAVGLSGAARAIPTLGLITLLGLMLGIGLVAPLLALIVLAVPSILAAAYTGIGGVPAAAVDGARAAGMTETQILLRVELPLGLPIVLGGLRSATLQVLATATLAAYVGAGGLGRELFLGLKTQDYPMMLGGSLVVIALALASELLFAVAQRLATRRAVPVMT